MKLLRHLGLVSTIEVDEACYPHVYDLAEMFLRAGWRPSFEDLAGLTPLELRAVQEAFAALVEGEAFEAEAPPAPEAAPRTGDQARRAREEAVLRAHVARVAAGLEDAS